MMRLLLSSDFALIVDPNQMTETRWMHFLIDWLLAIAIVIAGVWIAKRLSQLIFDALVRAGIESTLCNFLRTVSYTLMLVVIAVTALQKIGVPPASLAAIVGAACLAVGLSLKDSLANIASGVLLVVLRPFKEGDYVLIAGQEGVISGVGIFQTQMRTYDERVITLPNSNVMSSPIINYFTTPTRRLELPVHIGYDDDVERAKTILTQIAQKDERVLATPAPLVLVTELSNNYVSLLLLAYAKNDDFSMAKSSVYERILTDLNQEGYQLNLEKSIRVFHHDAGGEPLHVSDAVKRGVISDDPSPPSSTP